MMLPSMISSQTLVRKRHPKVLDHGTMVVDTSTTESTATFTGSPQPASGQVDLVNRDGAEVVYIVFAEPAADVRHNDSVELWGVDYQVSREPERWVAGSMSHVVIYLSRWEG